MKAVAAILALSILVAVPQQASAWGDDGHMVVALIAQQYLMPSARMEVASMLAVDTDPLTKHDIASEATWADKYRDEDNRKDHYDETERWHFVDMEISAPDINTACFGRTPLPAGAVASNGPPEACVVDKVKQFAAELAALGTDPEERIFALKFLLHFVGDMHQPLHSSDNHDRGGNDVKVSADGITHRSRDELHGYWDTQFVDGIAKPPSALATKLLAQITPAQAETWAQGEPDDWAMEAFAISQQDAYGNPPLSKARPQHLDAAYVAKAEEDVALQLSRAGVRLAALLNKALGK
jgi:S1/P1 Nuclease